MSVENDIVAKVQGKKIIITIQLILQASGFGDYDNDVYEFFKELIKRLFGRFKYNGNLNAYLYNKAKLCDQYRYLLNVLIHFLGGRRGGFWSL